MNPEKNPRSKDENQRQTQPTYDTGPESNPGHIGGRRALSPLRSYVPMHIYQYSDLANQNIYLVACYNYQSTDDSICACNCFNN